MVEWLLGRGAAVNGSSTLHPPRGFTPLHAAAGRGHYDVVALLLEYGADLTATTDDGVVPLEMAVRDDIRELISEDERFRRDHRFKRAVLEDRVGEPWVGAGTADGGGEDVEEEDDSSDGSCD